jgi:hypothetical protein
MWVKLNILRKKNKLNKMVNLFECIITVICHDHVTPMPLEIASTTAVVHGKFIIHPVPQMMPSLSGNKYLFRVSGISEEDECNAGTVVYTAVQPDRHPAVFTFSWKMPHDFTLASGLLSLQNSEAFRVKAKLHKSAKKHSCKLGVTIVQTMS